MATRLDALVDEIVTVCPDLSRDIAQKHVIQTKALMSMDRTGVLDSAVFQGGSAIFGCYGGIRLSEDLDFVSDEAISAALSEAFAADAQERIADELGVPVTVKAPKDLGKDVARWTLVADTVPDRPDLPSCKVKVEIARIPHATSAPLLFSSPHMPAPETLPPIVVAEEPTELVADKIVSFTMTDKFLRYRDLFDIDFLMRSCRIDIEALPDLCAGKIEAYGLSDAQERFDRVQALTAAENLAQGASARLSGMLVGSNPKERLSARMMSATVNASISLISQVTARLGLGTLAMPFSLSAATYARDARGREDGGAGRKGPAL